MAHFVRGRPFWQVDKRHPDPKLCTCPYCDKKLSDEELTGKFCSTCRRYFKTNVHGEPLLITWQQIGKYKID